MPGISRRPLQILAVSVCVLATAEICTRALEPSLPEPRSWPDATTAAKVAQMDQLGCAEVVFAGSSTARDAFDPHTFERNAEDAVTSYNAALDAASPTLLRAWLIEQVLPRLDPAVIVWGLTSADLSDGNRLAISAAEAYSSSVGGRSDLAGRSQRTLARWSALVRNRQVLRSPTEIAEAAARLLRGEAGSTPEGATDLIGPRGEGLSRRDLLWQPGNSPTAAARALLEGYRTGGRELDAAEAMLAELTDREVDVLVVLLPVTSTFVELHPRGAADLRDLRSTVQELADRHGLSVVDLAGIAGQPQLFADTHHLNGEGAHAVSLMVAESVALPQGRCPRSGA